MILLLDNYDSFTWNLHHYISQLTKETVVVKRNDEINLSEAGDYSMIILSPGPGLPAEAGIMPEIINTYAKSIPILGICLGHQAIGEAFGATLTRLDKVLHGVQRKVIISAPDDRLMKGMPDTITTGHYHSWVISENNFPVDVEVTARSASGTIMAISHKKYPASGVQFHPESIMTSEGLRIIKNWLSFCENFKKAGTE